jgi:hypothetical protein
MAAKLYTVEIWGFLGVPCEKVKNVDDIIYDHNNDSYY